MNAYRTPAVLSLIVIISYILSSILDFSGIHSLSQTAVLGLYIPLALMVFWFYVRYTGSLRELGQIIDNVTASIWEQLLQPVYQKLLEKGLQRAVQMGAQNAIGSDNKSKSD